MSEAIIVELTLAGVGLLITGVGIILRVVLRTDKAIPVIHQRLADHDRRIGNLEDRE